MKHACKIIKYAFRDGLICDANIQVEKTRDFKIVDSITGFFFLCTNCVHTQKQNVLTEQKYIRLTRWWNASIAVT